MKKKVKELVSELTHDGTKSIEERIDDVFAIRELHMSDDAAKQMDDDVIYFTSLITMALEENGPHLYDAHLLQLYTLLAEIYVEQSDFRQLKQVAEGVLELIRYEVTAWEVMEETMPRIIDAVGESVYNHNLYELLLHYFRAANREGKLTAEMKGHLRKLLKLKILLEDDFWMNHLFDKELQKAIEGLFSSDELLKIIMRPEIGHLRKDPVEYTLEWEEIYYDMEEELERRFANAPHHMGFCFRYWSAEKELLKEKYDIEWRSPSQMNPGVMFD